MPATCAVLASGEVTPEVALAVARQTHCVDPVDRRMIDVALAGRLPGLTPRKADRAAAAEAARVAPEALAARARKMEGERCVTVRPAPDAMVYLSALLPVKDGVAAYAALDRHATQQRAAGDERGRGQIMADVLVERLLGYPASQIPVEIQLVMPATTLAGGDEPGRIGDAVLPAEIARLLAACGDDDAGREIRRIFTHPVTRTACKADERARVFTGAARRMILLRDQTCASPTCDAPIRHVDHVTPYAAGGRTTVHNGSGLCERCNYTKEMPGWRACATTDDIDRRVVETTTPTGHVYRSTSPPVLDGPPERPPLPERVVSIESALRHRIGAHGHDRGGPPIDVRWEDCRERAG